MESLEVVTIPIKDKLTQEVLRDTLADAISNREETLYTIFDIGLSIVANQVSVRNPRLSDNLDKWLDKD